LIAALVVPAYQWRLRWDVQGIELLMQIAERSMNMPRWPWTRNNSANPVSIAEVNAIVDALKTMTTNNTPEDWGRIVEQRPVMLTPPAVKYLQEVIENQQREQKRSVAVTEVMRNFLQVAQAQGIPIAVATEKQRRDEVFEAVARFLSAPLGKTGQVLRERQSVLLTADAIRTADRLVKQLAANDDLADPLLGTRRRSREAQAHFLEDALAHGIDAAETRYNEAIADSLGRAFEEYQDATDPDRE